MVSTRSNQTKYTIRKNPTTTTTSGDAEEKWEVIYNNLKQLLLAAHSQVDTLKQRLLNHHFAWQSDLTLLNNLISQLRRELELSKLGNLDDISKAQLLLGFYQRDAFLANLKLEDARSELDDFRAWFDILTRRCPPDQENQFNEKERNLTNQLQAKNEEIKKANDKIATLVSRFERLQSSNTKKDETVSTLRANITKLEDEARQKDEMIASCFKELELLNSKEIPPLKRCSAEPSPSPCSSKRTNSSMDKERPDHANEGSSFALLEAANATVRAQLNKLEIEANHKNGEIGSLSKELNLLRSKGVENTPVLSRCTSTLPSSKLRSRGNCSDRGCAAPNEEASSTHPVSGKGGSKRGKRAVSLKLQGDSKRRKRHHEEVIRAVETPRLFTSQSKIPKLKTQSLCTR